MRFLKTYLMAAMALCIAMSSCKKDKDNETNPTRFSKTINTSNGLTIELSWKINDHDDGQNYADLDLYADDTTRELIVDYEFSSVSGSNTESIDINDGATAGTYFLGVKFADFEGSTTSGDAKYTIKIYPQGNAGDATTLTRTLEDDYEGNGRAYSRYKLTKSGTTYTIEELSDNLVFIY